MARGRKGRIGGPKAGNTPNMKPTPQIDKNQWQCWLSTLICGNKIVRETQDWQPSSTKADNRASSPTTPDQQGVVIYVRRSSKRQPHYIQTEILQIYRQKTDMAPPLAALCLLVLLGIITFTERLKHRCNILHWYWSRLLMSTDSHQIPPEQNSLPQLHFAAIGAFRLSDELIWLTTTSCSKAFTIMSCL